MKVVSFAAPCVLYGTLPTAVVFPGSKDSLEVFTTRPDTLFGATYMVIAPEHPQLEKLTTADNEAAVRSYVEAAASKSDLERTELQKDKSGVFTGIQSALCNMHSDMPIAEYIGPCQKASHCLLPYHCLLLIDIESCASMQSDLMNSHRPLQ